MIKLAILLTLAFALFVEQPTFAQDVRIDVRDSRSVVHLDPSELDPIAFGGLHYFYGSNLELIIEHPLYEFSGNPFEIKAQKEELRTSIRSYAGSLSPEVRYGFKFVAPVTFGEYDFETSRFAMCVRDEFRYIISKYSFRMIFDRGFLNNPSARPWPGCNRTPMGKHRGISLDEHLVLVGGMEQFVPVSAETAEHIYDDLNTKDNTAQFSCYLIQRDGFRDLSTRCIAYEVQYMNETLGHWATMLSPEGGGFVRKLYLEESKNSPLETLSSELRESLFNDPSDANVGNPRGEDALVMFYDLNCPFCRRAAPEIRQLISRNPDLRVVLKGFPILSHDSVDAAGIAIAVASQDGDFLSYFEALNALSGTVTRDEALRVAIQHGYDGTVVADAAFTAETKASVERTYDIARALLLTGTPTYILDNEIIVGDVGLEELQRRLN